MKNTNLVTLASIAICLLFSDACATRHCDASAAQSPLQVLLQQQRLKWSWADEAWTNNDKSYLLTKENVDQLVLQGKGLDGLLQIYKRSATNSPYNTLEQFRWAYLAFQMTLLPENQKQGVDKIGLSAYALDRPASPHSYEYDRMRYRIWSYLTPNYLLNSLGDRLLKRDPKNREIRFYVIGNFADATNWGERNPKDVIASQKKAITLLHKFIEDYPTDSAAYGLLGGIYSDMYLKSTNPVDQKNALVAFKESQKYQTPNSLHYNLTTDMLKRIQSGLVLYLGHYVYRDQMPR